MQEQTNTTIAGQPAHSMQENIQNCIECAKTCLKTIVYCIQKGGPFADSDHIQVLQDCARMCETAANFMMRDSHNHQITCAACAEICYLCAQSCEQYFDDVEIKKCAQIARSCARSCDSMAHGMASF
jgi:hypothetical protein